MLPDSAAVAERYVSGKALTRPEIGVLLSYAKIVLFDQLIESDLPDDPYCETTLANYFPAAMRKAFANDIAGHRLRREIIATVLANHAINRGGPGFVVSVLRCDGQHPDEAVKAALVTRDALVYLLSGTRSTRWTPRCRSDAEPALCDHCGRLHGHDPASDRHRSGQGIGRRCRVPTDGRCSAASPVFKKALPARSGSISTTRSRN